MLVIIAAIMSVALVATFALLLVCKLSSFVEISEG